MKRILTSLAVFTISAQFVNAQTNTPPLPNGDTKIGEHFHAGYGNELWTDSGSLYFNYRGNAAATYFWDKNGSTGSSILSIVNSGNVGIGTTQPAFALDIIRNNTNALLHLGKYNSSSGLFLYSDANITHYNWRISTQSAVDGGFEIARSASVGSTDWSSPYFVIKNGNVGIGTNNPLAFLHINQSSNTDWGAIISNNGGNGQGLLVKSGASTSSPIFQAQDNYGNVRVNILSNGNVGIGTTSPAYKLDVLGTIRAQEILVNLNGVADYVFESSYKIMPLNEVERFVKTNKHLPEIPSAKEVEKNGVNMGEMQNKLLQKIEELTLYMIEQNKKIENQNEKIITLENAVKELKTK